VVLLPEEWVRQHFIHYLIADRGYPKALVRIEGGLAYNQLSKRSDIVVFNRDGRPWMIVECKSPDIPITEAVLFQAATYNKTLQAKYLVVTNGLSHICSITDWVAGVTKRLPDMPVFGE
jgi:type I site-specific restriction endonuclease